MRERVLLLAITILTVLVMLTVPSVEATVYSCHAVNTNTWHVWLTVDTTADTLTVKWMEDELPAYPGKCYYCGSYIHVWDDDERIYWVDAPLGYHIIEDGQKTFTYTKTGINVYAEVKWCYSITMYLGFCVTVRCELYVPPIGNGGGCPILSVYDGTGYVEEGLLSIHNPDGIDEVASRVLTATPEPVEHRYLMRLTEHNQTHSYIDQVQLFATLTNGAEIRLPLVSAIHSADGNVLQELLLSDDVRTDTLGADHNNGTSEYIDLEFMAPAGLEIEEFTFTIEGHNIEWKV